MLLHNTNYPFEKKLVAVRRYLQTKQSLRKIASDLGISYKTLWFWVQQYKEKDTEGLKKRKPKGKKISKDIETKVMLLKEQNPSISIRKARKMMNKTGIQISNYGIWTIWQKYGFINKEKGDPAGIFTRRTEELEHEMKRAKYLIEKENYRGAANILNNLPGIPECLLLKMIPERFLSLRRRLERTYLTMGEIPFPQFLKKVRRIRESLEKNGFIYSSIIANFLELKALSWMGKPVQKMEVLDPLAKKMKGIKDNPLKFLLFNQQASTYARLFKVTQALTIIKQCRRLVYVLPHPYYWEPFGNLLTTVGKYKDALLFYKKALNYEENEKDVKRLFLRITNYGYIIAGKYSVCKKMLTKAKTSKNSLRYGSTYSLASAYLSYGQGNLGDASKFFVESLRKASKGRKYNLIFAASVGLAGLAMALNKDTEAKTYLRKYLPLMRKHCLAREELILKCLLSLTVNMQKEILQIPPLSLLNLLLRSKQTMKTGDYRKAYRYAQKQGLLGLFHRWIIFFPMPILRLLEKGKKTGLPKAILGFPVFNKKIPVYHMKFLGNFVVSKNQQYLKTRLTPKEKAFFIQLALKTDTSGKFILLNNLYQNFWARSKNPSSLLLHLLSKLKKKLRLPGHLLCISSESGEPRLVNRGIYITTDHDDLETLLAQAKALERAGEWPFAKKEYLRAFKLFRGEPFKKMYDPWSEHMRRVILNELETETMHFAKSCLERGNETDAKRVLDKVTKIIPQSEESAKILQTL